MDQVTVATGPAAAPWSRSAQRSARRLLDRRRRRSSCARTTAGTAPRRPRRAQRAERRAGDRARGGAGQRDALLPLNAELEETNRGVMALYAELSERAGAHQPGRGRAVRRARRQAPPSCARPARPRPASWPTSATSCAPRSTPISGWPGCCSTRRRAAHRGPDRSSSSSSTLSAEDLLARWSTSCSTWPRPSPAGSSRPCRPVDLADVFDELRGTMRPAGHPAGRHAASSTTADRHRGPASPTDPAAPTCCATC